MHLSAPARSLSMAKHPMRATLAAELLYRRFVAASL
jgi:hypothetical protein